VLLFCQGASACSHHNFRLYPVLENGQLVPAKLAEHSPSHADR
jgi:hypothetical protein